MRADPTRPGVDHVFGAIVCWALVPVAVFCLFAALRVELSYRYQVEGLRHDLGRCSRQRDGLRWELEHVRAESRRLAVALHDTEEDLQRARSERDQRRRELSDRQAGLEEVREELRVARTAVGALRAGRARREAERLALRRDVLRLSGEVDVSEARVREVTEERQRAVQRYLELLGSQTAPREFVGPASR